MEPQPGVAYPLVLGGTLLGKRKAGEEYCSLRYDFLPASAARAGQGHLEVHADSHVRQGGVGGWGLLLAGRQARHGWCVGVAAWLRACGSVPGRAESSAAPPSVLHPTPSADRLRCGRPVFPLVAHTQPDPPPAYWPTLASLPAPHPYPYPLIPS